MPSKLGVHINFVREADAMRDFLLTARPAVALAIDPDAGFWAEIKQEAPEIFLIGRICFNLQPWGAPGLVASTIVNHPASHVMDAWQGLNEPTREELASACALDKAVARILHDNGMFYICGSWSTGVPDLEDWKESIMHEALREADYIGIHAYNAPSMDEPRGLEWWLYRHRQWYDDLPPECQKPVLITETGIDGRSVHWPLPEGGWRLFTDEEGYARQLRKFDAELAKDPYVKGATVFQWGSLDPQWDSYDLTPPLISLLKEHIVSQKGGEPPISDLEDQVRQLTLRVEDLESSVRVLYETGFAIHTQLGGLA